MASILNSCTTLPSTSFATSQFPYSFLVPPTNPIISSHSSCNSISTNTRRKTSIPCFGVEKSNKMEDIVINEEDDCFIFEHDELLDLKRETMLYSFSPVSLMLLAALPGAETVRSVFGPFVELIKSWNLPGWLVHWGHPGNMAVVLFAMGGYGTYLGFRIRFSDDMEERAKAKDLHPKLLGGMFFFFALGATGGVTSLLTSDRPIFESPHAITGLIGLTLLTIQTILPALFEGNPGLRNVHGILGSGIMTLFLVHAALGLQLGLSY
ncbi:Crossover junction endodeoxyribonuclease RuvC [Bienertia sinuspersici]